MLHTWLNCWDVICIAQVVQNIIRKIIFHVNTFWLQSYAFHHIISPIVIGLHVFVIDLLPPLSQYQSHHLV